MVLNKAILFYFQKPIFIAITLSDLLYRIFEANKCTKNSSDSTCTSSLNFQYFCYQQILQNVKQYQTGQALRVPGVWGSQISRQSAHEGGKDVSPTHRPVAQCLNQLRHRVPQPILQLVLKLWDMEDIKMSKQ